LGAAKNGSENGFPSGGANNGFGFFGGELHPIPNNTTPIISNARMNDSVFRHSSLIDPIYQFGNL
jgi:hypothetical protein